MNSIFNRSKKKTNKLRDYVKSMSINSELPKDFFLNISLLEMNIDTTFEIETMQELIKQYSKAIEFYESRNDDKKYKEYEYKLNNLLSKPELIEKMSLICKNSKYKLNLIQYKIIKNRCFQRN